LFFGGLAGFRRFLERRVDGVAGIVDLLALEQLLDTQNLDAWIFVLSLSG